MKVEIWSDVVCPWCYVGKRRFETALARFPQREQVELVWRSFELDPAAPPSPEVGGGYAERLAAKYGRGVAQAQEMVDTMTQTAAAEGLDFRFDLSRPGNTFDAHRLLHLALAHGLQDPLKERLDRATFSEGLRVSDHAALTALAVEVGLPEGEVRDVLATDRYADAVRADEAQAAAHGISGVPFFVVDGRYGVSGAQPAETIEQVLDDGLGRAGSPAGHHQRRRGLRGRQLRGVTLRRSAALLSLPLGAAALGVEGAARRLAGQDREQVRQQLRRRNAERTRRVLGGLKGGALKAGQLLSTVEALFPPDPEDTWRSALTTLQDSNPALPFAEVEPVLVAELGPAWRDLFDAFGEQAAAAASLGQVHRATWAATGRQVAVKVQYPGVREALAADVRTLSLVSRAAALVARGLAVPPLVAEMRVRLTEELDYLHEAAAQRALRRGLRRRPRRPRAARSCTPPGGSWSWTGSRARRWPGVAEAAPQDERDRVAGLYQRFLVSGPERAGLLHTDPHPGNFRVLPDGRLGVLDFGSTLALPGMPETFGRLIGALLAGDGDAVLARLRADGFLRPGRTVDVAKLVDYMGPFTVPAAARAVPLLAGLAARRVRPGERPARPRLRRRAAADPAGRAPVHPPGLAGPGRRAVPARGRGGCPGRARALAARLPRGRLSVRAAAAARRAPRTAAP